MESTEADAPFRRQCTWCESVVPGIERINCPNCGGPLPMVPFVLIEEAGLSMEDQEPPAVPRDLPEGYVKTRNMQRQAGPLAFIGCGVLFFWTLVVPLAAVYGVWRLHRQGDRVQLMRNGRAVLGRLTKVYLGRKSEKRGQHVVLSYAFDLDGVEWTGHNDTYDPSAPRLRVGDPVWIIVDPSDPGHRSHTWPPGPGRLG